MGADYYAVLGLPPDACRDEIQHAYRELVRRYHPDHNPGDPAAAKRFAAIESAYEILCEPARHEPTGAYHTVVSVFLTVRCRAHSFRRDGMGASTNFAPPLIAMTTLFYVVLCVAILMMASSNSPAGVQAGDGEIMASLLGRVANQLGSAGFLLSLLTVLYLGFLGFLVFASASRKR
jgi:hypothetical protein